MSGLSDGPRQMLVATTERSAGGATVSIRDSSPGLAPDTAGGLFEAFYSTKPDGLGIGLFDLPIDHRVAWRQGKCHVELSQRGPSSGSTYPRSRPTHDATSLYAGRTGGAYQGPMSSHRRMMARAPGRPPAQPGWRCARDYEKTSGADLRIRRYATYGRKPHSCRSNQSIEFPILRPVCAATSVELS